MGCPRATLIIVTRTQWTKAVSKLCWSAPGASPILPTGWNEQIEQAVIKLATGFPAYGQGAGLERVAQIGGCLFRPSGVRSIWLRHDLNNFKLRLKALEAKVASEGGVLTEAQVQALEKKKLDDEGAWRNRHRTPRLSGLSGHFLCRHIEGVSGGFISRPMWTPTARSPTPSSTPPKHRSPPPTCSMIKSCPYMQEHELPVLRILTDRGTEYCGRKDKHDYQLFLAINEIEHTKTKVRHPQTKRYL